MDAEILEARREGLTGSSGLIVSGRLRVMRVRRRRLCKYAGYRHHHCRPSGQKSYRDDDCRVMTNSSKE